MVSQSLRNSQLICNINQQLIIGVYMIASDDIPNAVAYAFDAVGGLCAAAKVCGRSYQALNKWRQAESLPRTDYTGETCYAALLANAAAQKGNPFDPAWLLRRCVSHKALS